MDNSLLQLFEIEMLWSFPFNRRKQAPQNVIKPSISSCFFDCIGVFCGSDDAELDLVSRGTLAETALSLICEAMALRAGGDVAFDAAEQGRKSLQFDLSPIEKLEGVPFCGFGADPRKFFKMSDKVSEIFRILCHSCRITEKAILPRVKFNFCHFIAFPILGIEVKLALVCNLNFCIIMSRLIKARIIGTGSYLPEKVLSNRDLQDMVETSDEWIVSRTGMRERRIAASDEFTSDMGYKASLKALEAAKMQPEQIDFIVVASCTPDFIFPGTACLLQARLKAVNAAALDVQAACTGYIYALSLAKAYVQSGLYRNVLVVASEKLSSIIDYQDRNTCILFGDGAAACVVSDSGEGLVIRDVRLGADGELAEVVTLPAGGCRSPATLKTVSEKQHFLHMDGKEVFKHAVRRMESASKQCLDSAGLSEADISWLIPHQANIRIIEAIAKRFSIPGDRIYLTIHKYGNTSASSIGIALDELLREQGCSEGENILLTAFGAGLAWGASVLTWQQQKCDD